MISLTLQYPWGVGSWNRGTPIGYPIRLATFHTSQPASVGFTIFARGWLQGNRTWARPVDIINGPVLALLVSGDEAHAICHIHHEN